VGVCPVFCLESPRASTGFAVAMKPAKMINGRHALFTREIIVRTFLRKAI
jgi:hypothetical protein